MLRAKQRLSAAFSRQHSHTSDEQTVVGSPLQLLDPMVAIHGLSVLTADLSTISSRLTILAGGHDIAQTGHTITATYHLSSLTWSISPPLRIVPEMDLRFQFFYKRSIKHPSRKPAEPVQLAASTLIEACTDGEPEHVYDHLNGAVHASLILKKNSIVTSPQGSASGRPRVQGSEEIRSDVNRNSSKTFTFILLRLGELQRIDSFALYEEVLSELKNMIEDVIKPIENCPMTLFDVFDGLGLVILSTLGLLASPECHDRPQACPITVSTALALLLNACTLMQDMAGPAPDEPISEWLRKLSKEFTQTLKRAMRSIEERKNESIKTNIYDPEDARSRHNEDRLVRSDSRSTLSMDQDKLIEQLDPHFLPTGYPTSLCMEGTRVEILRNVKHWLDDFKAPNVLWLRGGPGMGKNTLIWTIANMLERRQRNASFFFFRQQHYTPLDLWRTVACSLAWYHPALKAAVSVNLNREPSDLLRNVPRIFEALIADPLRVNAQLLQRGGVAPVIVIGSLDACIQTDKRQWRALLQTLTQWLDLVPKECKLVFTSCYHEDIEELLGGSLLTKRIDVLPADSREDISTYVHRRALSIQTSLSELADTASLDHRHLTRLIDHAAGLFLWARAAMDYIASSADPPRALEALADRGLHQKLDDVDEKFDSLLEDAFDGIKPSGFRATLGAISLAFRPVSVSELRELLGPSFSSRQPDAICAHMSSVLNLADVPRQRLRIYHPAFTAYLADARRVGLRYDGFLVDPDKTHRRLARSCLKRMLDPKTGLHFNMRPHSSSYVEVDELDAQQILSSLPSSLEYSCQFWHEHLLAIAGDIDSDLIQSLNDLVRVRLLFWIEVMSDLGVLDSAVQAMIRIARRLQDQDSELCALANETSRFLLAHMDAIASNASHIYTSALAFLPSTSVLHPLYSHLFTGVPRVVTDPPLRLQPLHAIYDRLGEVKSVCISSDGSWMLVARQLDQSSALLHKVELASGATISTSASVNGTIQDIKLYRDGEKDCAVAAVTDGTVQLWCVTEDIQLLAALKGHEDYVRCVDVDRTGLRLVSGSDDCTLVVWNTSTTKSIAKPFTGHKDWIRAVLFTEDGQRIVSGSDDKSIRMWDTEAGVELRRICVHGSPVRSLALCPAGLISGGDDGSIVVIAMESGTEVYRRSRAHCAAIRSLTYDPTNTHGASFVSGAADGTIQLWDEQLRPVKQRLYLHTSSVINVVRVDRYFISTAEGFRDQETSIVTVDGSIITWDPWDAPETPAESGSPPIDGSNTGIDLRMGRVLLVQASEDGSEVYAVDTHGIWRWSSEGNFISKRDFISEHQQTLGPARAAALSLAGRKAAISLADGCIRIVDTSTGRAIHEPFDVQADDVKALVLSDDGEYLIASAADGSVYLCSITTALIDPSSAFVSLQMISDLGVPCVAMSSTHYAYALEEVYLYARGSTVRAILDHNAPDESENVCALRFAKDGSTLGACYPSGRVTVWKVEGGGIVYSRVYTPIRLNDDLSCCVVFDGTLKMLAYIPSGLGLDPHEYCIVNLKTGKMADTICGGTAAPTCGAFLHDASKLIVGSSDGVIRIVDYRGSARYAYGPSHDDSVRVLAFAPDGRFIASGDDSGQIVLWDTEHNERVSIALPHQDEWLRALIFTPDGKYLLSAGDDCTIRGWRVPALTEAFEPCQWHRGPVRTLVLSADGRTLFTAGDDNFAGIWELPSTSADNPRPVHVDQLDHSTRILCAALSEHGTSLATGAVDGVVNLWVQTGDSWASRACKPLSGHNAAVNALAYISDSKAFVSGGEDRTLRVWDASTGAALRTIQAHDNVVHALATCSARRVIFSASRDATIRVWDVTTGEETALPLRIHPAPVLSLALSPDGRCLISGDSDGRVIIHDVASSLRVWPEAFQRSVAGPNTICGVDKQGIALGAQLHEDGWLRGRRGETLIWIPPAYRPGFSGPSCCVLMGTPAVSLDLRTFANGDAWSSSYVRSHQTSSIHSANTRYNSAASD